MSSNESLAWEFKSHLKKKINLIDSVVLQNQAEPFVRID